MATRLKPFALSIAMTMIVSFSAKAELVVIVNPSNDAQISAKNVKRIFLGKEKSFSTGNQTIPVNQPPEAGIREQFDKSLLGRSTSQVSAYWSKLVFTGKGIPPKEVPDDAAVIDIVGGNNDAIGYVDSASVTDAVKVVNL